MSQETFERAVNTLPSKKFDTRQEYVAAMLEHGLYPHIERGDSPRFCKVYSSVSGKTVRHVFGDWVCTDKNGYYGRGKTQKEAYDKYIKDPQHFADSQ